MANGDDDLFKFKSVQITTKLDSSYELVQLLEHISKSGFLIECNTSCKQISSIVKDGLNQVTVKRFRVFVCILTHSCLLSQVFPDGIVTQIMKNLFLDHHEVVVLKNKVIGTFNTFWVLTS